MMEKRKMRRNCQEFHQKKFISLYNREKQKKLKCQTLRRSADHNRRGTRCVFYLLSGMKEMPMKEFIKKHPVLADVCDVILSLLCGSFALLAFGIGWILE